MYYSIEKKYCLKSICLVSKSALKIQGGMQMQGVMLYIDPGTGSMLFTVLLGVATTGIFFVHKLILKIKFSLGRGKNVTADRSGWREFVIFSDDKRYWTTFHPICDEFERRGIKAYYWTASPDDPALEENYNFVECEFIGEGNRAFARLNMMRADICLSTTPGLDVYQWKRSPNVKYYVHILHSATTAIGYRMFGLDFFDAVLLSGDFQIDEIRRIEKLREIPQKELKIVGCTYLDAMRKRREQKTPVQNEVTNVLLAPSWGPSSLLSLYGEKLIQSLVDTGYRLIIRPHPQSMKSEKEKIDGLMKRFPASEMLEWNFDNDNFDVLDRADIMITDFSGVVFDYTMLFGKPVIYAEGVFDSSIYDAAWLDEPMWRIRVLPDLGVPLREDDFGRLKELIDSTIKSEVFLEGRNRVREEAWCHIGESVGLVVDYLLDKRSEICTETENAA